ncbi:MAG: WecB/TagA/CpsF family glycosyltransferase [Planctomycetota bacterium]|nr:WecB/TagA/CpsF family glycosyltransferase [Planctomycetota bacterium]
MLSTNHSSNTFPAGAPVVYIPREQSVAEAELPLPVVAQSVMAQSVVAPAIVKSPAKTQPTQPPAQLLPLLPLPTSRVWGIDYSAVNMKQTLQFIDELIARRVPTTVITSNLNYAMLNTQHPKLEKFTHKCPLVICDGMPIFWRSKLNETKLPERIAGADLIFELAAHSAKKGYRIFLMGGAEGVALRAAKRLEELYPDLKIAGVECPPFRPLSDVEHKQLLSRIREAKADILLVAFGQPKGEFWIDDNMEKLDVPVSIQLGASFDFIVGSAKRAPVWIQKMGFEWLYRTYHDPKRLVPRYAKNAWFLLKSIRRDLLDATN